MRLLPIGADHGGSRSAREKRPNPTDADIDELMMGNICRCGTYQDIRRAVHRAAELKAQGAKA